MSQLSYYCWTHSNQILFSLSAIFPWHPQWLDSNCWTGDYESIVLPTVLATTFDWLSSTQAVFFSFFNILPVSAAARFKLLNLGSRVNCSTNCICYHCWMYSTQTFFSLSSIFSRYQQRLDSNCWTWGHESTVLLQLAKLKSNCLSSLFKILPVSAVARFKLLNLG
jgi:hypothetical protein